MEFLRHIYVMNDIDKIKEFEAAIDLYGGIITKISYYFSTDSEEFKDIRQEVLYNIWKGWDNFRHDSKRSTWIYRVTFNTCISYNRKEKKVKNRISLEEVLDLPAESEPGLLEKYKTMHSLIQKLGYEDRAIILMWLDEKNYEEIAELMGINRNSLAVRLKRIKERLIKMSKRN